MVRNSTFKTLGVIILLQCLVAGGARAVLLSTFDSDTEGWSTISGASGFTWVATGGNPDGRIRATDGSGLSSWYFLSPDSWDGDWSEYIGATLSYDILEENLLTPTNPVFDVRITGATAGQYATWTAPGELVAQTWNSFSVDLVASNFTATGASFEAIMANVTQLWILGDYGGVELTSLDNVQITMVPEPSSMGLLVIGAMGCVMRRKRG